MEQTLTTAMRRSRPIAFVCAAAALLVCVALIASGATPADAATNQPARKHTVSISIKEAAIHVDESQIPGVPLVAKEAGLFSGSLGNGVNKTVVHVIDGYGTRVFFTRHGSFHGRFVFHGEHQAGGTPIIGTLTVTGGTGRFADAHGKLHIDGFHDDSTGYSVEHLTGTLSY
jgi:hypothetical protein